VNDVSVNVCGLVQYKDCNPHASNREIKLQVAQKECVALNTAKQPGSEKYESLNLWIQFP
jgi:hypothetical protein